MTASQTHRKLTPDVIERAASLAAEGLPVASIIRGCRISVSGFRAWLQRAATPEASPLESQLLERIQEARVEGEQALVRKLLSSQDTADARWLLTHGPWRDGRSDRAADRRAVAQATARFIEAISPEDEQVQRRLLLRMQAHGLAATPLPDLEPLD